MYFNDKGDTNIDENLKYDAEKKKKDMMKDIIVYSVLGFIFLIGIILIIAGLAGQMLYKNNYMCYYQYVSEIPCI